MCSTKLNLTERENQSTRRLNRERKLMRCLGCDRMIKTDRCHRFCRECRRRINRGGLRNPRTARVPYTSGDLNRVLDVFRLEDLS